MWPLITLAVLATGLAAWRASDRRADDRVAAELRNTAPAPPSFDPQLVAGLPDPARRYFLHAIEPGTPVKLVAELETVGELGLARKDVQKWLPIKARQVLGLDGFVWQVRAGRGVPWLSGSDGYAAGEGWTRFWLFGLLPVVRAGGGNDYARSAAGRTVAEALFWVPAALLPSPRVRWEPVDADTARAVVTIDGHEHRVELTVTAEGQPRSVSLMRWSRENPEREWRLQPFGGTIGAVRVVGGVPVAAEVEGGNWFGTPGYLPFYRARLSAIRFH